MNEDPGQLASRLQEAVTEWHRQVGDIQAPQAQDPQGRLLIPQIPGYPNRLIDAARTLRHALPESARPADLEDLVTSRCLSPARMRGLNEWLKRFGTAQSQSIACADGATEPDIAHEPNVK